MSGVQTICGSCGSAVRVGAAFCPRCGGAQRSVAAVGVGEWGTPQAASAAAAPAWLDPARIAPPGLRVLSWLVEMMAFGVLGLVLGLLVTLVSVWGMGAGASLTTVLILVAWVPLIIIVAAFVAVWVWEGRTGNRIGNLITRVRTVDATTGGNPGMGRVLGSRMILALPSGLVYGLAVLVTRESGGLSAAASWLPAVAQTAVVLVMVGSGAWGSLPLRQGWHERASGTTVVRVVRSAGSGPVAAGFGTAPLSAPAPAATPVAMLPVAMPAQLTAPAQPPLVEQRPQVVSHPVPTLPAGGMIADVPGFAPSAPRPDPIDAPPVARPAAPTPAPVAAAESDDIEHTRMSRRDRSRSTAFTLSFDTGEVVDLAGPGLVGRAPQAAPGELVEHLVAIVDPDRSVSKTHVAFGLDAGGPWVADRRSTNGTRVVPPGGEPIEVGESPVAVPEGATVHFGERSFLVRRG